MRSDVLVLYEDSAAQGNVPEFGLHNLVVSCVADRLGQSPWSLHSRIDGRPLRSNTKLLAALGEGFDRLLDSASLVVAVLDYDEAPRLLRADETCMSALRGALCLRTPGAEELLATGRLEISFLVENLETILRSLRELGFTHAGLEAALAKKPLARDRVLNALAYAGSASAIRAALVTKVPSFGRLVAKVERALP